MCEQVCQNGGATMSRKKKTQEVVVVGGGQTPPARGGLGDRHIPVYHSADMSLKGQDSGRILSVTARF